MMVKRAFKRTIGIDYSGARTPVVTPVDKDGNDTLAVYCADGYSPPQIVRPQADASGSRRWTRRKIAEWLVDELQEQDKPTLVGIDHAFSFPISYFQKYNTPLGKNWDYFLDDFQKYWPTHEDKARVAVIRQGSGRERTGDPAWFRLTDRLSGSAKSVFHFGIPGQVAPSTHAGLPWLRYIRGRLRNAGVRVHFWPFDGWQINEGTSVVAEVYPALLKHRFEQGNMSDHEYDAYSVAGWLSHADRNGYLSQHFNPDVSWEERNRADVEGWILGVLGYIRFDQGLVEADGSRE